jgi:hypothetical protein
MLTDTLTAMPTTSDKPACQTCDGLGRFYGETCATCHGSGHPTRTGRGNSLPVFVDVEDEVEDEVERCGFEIAFRLDPQQKRKQTGPGETYLDAMTQCAWSGWRVSAQQVRTGALDETAERASFEVKLEITDWNKRPHPAIQGDYQESSTQCAWNGWLTRARRAAAGARKR